MSGAEGLSKPCSAWTPKHHKPFSRSSGYWSQWRSVFGRYMRQGFASFSALLTDEIEAPMIARINGWLPVLMGAFIVTLVIVATSILAALHRLDTPSVTFVLGGALGWAGGQRAPVHTRNNGETST